MNTSSRPTPAAPAAPRRAIVTGHSDGLGLALADALLGRGFAVLGIARRGAPSLRHHVLFDEVALDLSDTAAVAAWLAGAALATFTRGAAQALLVNNAGSVAPVAAPGRQGAGAIAGAVALNVAAPLMLADAFVAASAGVADRRILHVSSGAARSPYAGWSAYCATKAALDMHARAVQADAVPALRIASIAPGVVDTAMQATLRATGEADFPQHARFVRLKADGALSTPADAAAGLLDRLLADGFGDVALADLRDAVR